VSPRIIRALLIGFGVASLGLAAGAAAAVRSDANLTVTLVITIGVIVVVDSPVVLIWFLTRRPDRSGQ
jgi:hypothetical protein